MTTDLDLITEIALAAGKLATEVRAAGLKIEHKPGGSPVTNGDLASDALLKEHLLAARPDYGWLSEETLDQPDRLDRRRTFVVDPIDGTSAYLKGRDWWTVCVAVVEDGRPIAGVVIAPSLGEIYSAAAGQGATLNGRPLRTADRMALEGCTMLGDAKLFADPRWPEPWPPMDVVQRNSIAYRMTLVASGAFDACFAPGPKQDWDLAAADLIVAEAGGCVTDNAGRSFIYNRPVPMQAGVICAGPALHPLLVARTAHIDSA